MERSLICVVVGHVDHGKTLLLDKIRGSAIAAKEAGAITQCIGCSLIPSETIKKICSKLIEKMNISFKIPGLLFIDTPGHEAFASLRKRGGSIADMAILVIDINEGIMPQTIESINILKHFKTPFVIAANKIDLIDGWQKKSDILIENINMQTDYVKVKFEEKLYDIVTKIYENFQMDSDRFDRVDDYTKKIAIVPCSAKTGEGIPELLLVLVGLAQKYLQLEADLNKAGKGVILEVKEEKGLGKTIDVILYDGNLEVNDEIIFGSLEGPIKTKIRALLEPMPLKETREKAQKFKHVKKVFAASGVKISAPLLDKAIAGMPIYSLKGQDEEKIKQEIEKELSSVIFETDREGIIIKADTLGSLEALTKIFKEKNVKIKKAGIGNVTKKDVMDAEASYVKDPFTAVIIAFNVDINKDVTIPENVKILKSNIIYKIIDDFEKFVEEEKQRQIQKEIQSLTLPCKIKIIPTCIFRISNPAIVGVDILEGTLKQGIMLMKNGKAITKVRSIQKEKESLQKAEAGMQVAIALENVTIGRQIKKDDILYSYIPEKEFKRFKELKKYLDDENTKLLREIAEIMRKEKPTWGM